MDNIKLFKILVVDSRGNLVEKKEKRLVTKKVPVIRGSRKKSSSEKS